MNDSIRLAACVAALVGAAGCATTTAGAQDGATATPSAPAPGFVVGARPACAGKIVVGATHLPTPGARAATVALAPLAYEAGEDGFAFIDGRTGQALTWQEVAARARAADATIIGEQHDDVFHHRLQRRVVEAVAERGAAVGLEMVTWPNQPVLDRFAKGEIDVDALAIALDWPKSWGHDFQWYAPIFAAAQQRGAALIALNAPRPLVHAVAKKGIAGLDDAECAELPMMDLSDEEHRKAIAEVFSHHGPSMSGDAFERFYSAQVLWDESMAQRAADALSRGAPRIVVLAGVGHVQGGRGIPQRLARRSPEARIVTIVPVTLGDDETPEAAVQAAIKEAAADVLVVRRPEDAVAL